MITLIAPCFRCAEVRGYFIVMNGVLETSLAQTKTAVPPEVSGGCSRFFLVDGDLKSADPQARVAEWMLLARGSGYLQD